MTKRSDSITIRDVAKQAGVSVATVSRFINHNAPVSNEIAKKIQEVMNDLEYVPLLAARQLATRKTGTIGLLSFTVEYGFFGPLVAGLESILKENGYNLLIATYPVDSRENVPPIGPQNTDGVVVFSNTLSENRLNEWHQMQFPMVLVHRTTPASLPIPSVNVENIASSRKLVDHLIEDHGRRRIMFMRGPGHQEDTQYRELGYTSALAAHSIPTDPCLIVGGEYDRRDTRQALEYFFLNDPPEFDAIFAGDDDLAAGVVSALQNIGRKVPNEIAVVGFDDQRFASLMVPALTTVHAPTDEVGKAAGRQLLRLLQCQPVEPITVLPTNIMIRQSCGCPLY
jgi:LacI family transcriptional regulator